jgi:hypothetical protein
MADLRVVRKEEPLPDNELHQIVSTLMVNAVWYGSVTIRYEHGRPTMIERHEQVRLTGTPPKPG